MITSWNIAAERMFGYSAKEVLGKPISILVPKDGQEEFNLIMEKIKKDQRIEHFETKRLNRDGKIINVSVTLSPIKNKEGKIIGISKIVRNITERKKSEQERIKLASIVESSEDAILGMDLDGIIDSWNSGAVKMFGYKENEIIGMSVQSIYPSERAGELADIIKKLKSGQRIEHFETERKRKDGSIIDVSLSISPIKNEVGSIVGIAKIIRDISGQKRTSAYARSLIEASLDPLVTISPEGKITDVNEATVKITGIPRGKLIGSDFSDYFTEPEEAREGYERVFKEGFVTDYPLSIRNSSGQITDVLYNASVYKDDKEKVLGVFAAARDVTERKKVEEQLHATSAYARSLIEASLDPLVTISPEGKVTDVNEATVKVTGVTREWLIGTDFSNYFTEPRRAREGYRLTFKEGSVNDYPLTIRHSSNKTTDVLYNASVYKNDKGKVLGVFAAARDVTETKKVSQYARSLIEASLDPLVTISPEGKVTDVNEATVKITGMSREKLIGSDFSDYFTEPEKAREGYERVFKKGFVTDYPLSIRNSSGQITDVLYNASVYKDDKGKVLGVFAAARNATRVKQKDEFSAMVTHELKTPLGPIIGYCDMFKTSMLGTLTEEQTKAMEVIERNALRLEGLISDIMDARKLDMDKIKLHIEDLSIDEFFDNIVSSYDVVLRNKGIKFVTKLYAKGIIIKTDKTRLRQIVDNLISNSIKFVPESNGMIEVVINNDHANLITYVKDNGIGIPVEKQKELFKKFYQIDTSQRRPAGGTGLGLAISKGIIENLGGSIWVESDGELGTTFYFKLPLNTSSI